MRTISFAIKKGGVGKTVSANNFAAILAKVYGKKVLLVDADKQWDLTRMYFPQKDYFDGTDTLTDILMEQDLTAESVIVHTRHELIDLLPADMSLQKAEKDVLLDSSRPQQTRFKRALKPVQDKYDFCIIDCPGNIEMCTINALVVSDDVISPVVSDNFSFEAINAIKSATEAYSEYNDNLKYCGCFMTRYANNNLCRQTEELLKADYRKDLFSTHIRQSVKLGESTFKDPLIYYDPSGKATKDYIDLVAEYLNRIKD